MSKQRRRTFVTDIRRKTGSSLVKIVSDGENNLMQNKYNNLPNISAKNKSVFCKKISAEVQRDHPQFKYMVIT